MKKNKFISFTICSVLLIIISTSCHKQKIKECESLINVPIISAVAPNIGILNQNIYINLSFEKINNCYEFAGTSKVIKTDTIIFRTFIKSSGCTCSPIAGLFQTVDSFSATTPGTYYLKFEQTPDNFLVDSLLIQ